MNTYDCSEIEEFLIDYSDGELAPADTAKVTAHLAECTDCRCTLSALQESLNLATMVWKDNLEQPPALKMRSKPLNWHRCAALAASIAILAAAAIFWHSASVPQKPEPTLAQIEQEMFESSTAAKILAIADMLAKQKNAEDFVREQYSFVIRTYPDTPAAEKAKLKLGTI